MHRISFLNRGYAFKGLLAVILVISIPVPKNLPEIMYTTVMYTNLRFYSLLWRNYQTTRESRHLMMTDNH